MICSPRREVAPFAAPRSALPGAARSAPALARVRTRLLGLALAVAIAGAALPALAANPQAPAVEPTSEADLGPVSLAAGPEGGYYLELARQVRRYSTFGGEPLEIHTTAGSFQNLAQLEDGGVRYALAQQDVVAEYCRLHPDTRVRVVGRLFHDYLHILVRRPIHIDSAHDFQHLRLWPGEDGSGTRYTAVRFLESAGLPLSALDHPPDELSPAFRSAFREGVAGERFEDLFQEGGLDAAMMVTAAGSPAMCEAMAGGRFYLLALDYRTLRILTNEDPADVATGPAGEPLGFRHQIVLGSIPAETYPFQSEAVPTLAVPVLLLARDSEPAGWAEGVLQTVRKVWAMRRPFAPGCRAPTAAPHRSQPLSASGLAMLPGLAAEPEGTAMAPLLTLLGVGAAILLLGIWGYRRGIHRVLHDWWKQDRVALWGLLALAGGIVGITVATYLIERDINENFSNLAESFWSITIYLFSGLEDRTPYRPAGKAVATLGLLLGPVFFAVLTGWLARFFIQWEKRMPRNLKNHYLILNWNPRAQRVIRELHHPVITAKEGVPVIVVLTDDDDLDLRRLKQAGSGKDPAFEDLYLSVGDPTSERALLNANAQDAHSILLLADDRLGAHADEKTLRSLMMLRRIAREREVTGLHLVVELVEAANEGAVEEMVRDFPGTVELVSGLELRTFLLAQAALSAGVVEFYRDLLRVSDDTSEVYTLPIPEAAAGSEFRAYVARVMAVASHNPMIPVGVQRRVEGRLRILTNPRPGAPGWTLEPGDRLVVVAYEPPVSEILERLPEPAGA